ncbi:MAG: MFS transporter [Paracoccus sp. (in: a-proteobacteria)]
MTTSEDHPSQPLTLSRARRNVIVLVAAQAFLGAQMSIIFITGGLVGQTLAPNRCLATLPISMIVLGAALTAQPLAGFMQRHGRRAGFILAVLAGALGATISWLGIRQGSFALFIAGSVLTGIYMASQGFYRFAATDTAPPGFEAKAISWVMAGGLASAIIGPAIVRLTDEMMAIPYMATYAAIICINLAGLILFAALDIPRPVPHSASRQQLAEGRSTAEILRDPVIIVAIICAMVSYALMNLVMTSAPLAIVGCGMSSDTAANVVSAHVLAMFIPSFFTGHLIARFGTTVIVGLGLVIMMLAGVAALSGIEVQQFYMTLILLGIGWNFSFIGATAMITNAHSKAESGRVQGINDLVVFSGVFLASLSSGGLMNCSGTADPQSGWNTVNMAMVPFLIMAGGALIWLRLRPAPE